MFCRHIKRDNSVRASPLWKAVTATPHSKRLSIHQRPRAGPVSCRIRLSSAGVHPVPGWALLWALSENPNSSCMFSPILSANFVGSQRKVGCAVLSIYSNRMGGEAPSGRVNGGAGSCTKSILLGFRRLMSRRTQPHVRRLSAYWTHIFQMKEIYIQVWTIIWHS